METIGKKIIKLSYVVGFSAQLATGIAVIIGSYLGLPLSTTHCMVGSLLGVFLARKIPFCKYSFVLDEQRAEVDEFLVKMSQVGVEQTKVEEEPKIEKHEDVSPAINAEDANEFKEEKEPASANKLNPVETEKDVVDAEAPTAKSANPNQSSKTKLPPWISGHPPAHGAPAKEVNSINFGLNKKLFGKIFLAWVATVPAAFSMSYVLATLFIRWNKPPSTVLI